MPAQYSLSSGPGEGSPSGPPSGGPMILVCVVTVVVCATLVVSMIITGSADVLGPMTQALVAILGLLGVGELVRRRR